MTIAELGERYSRKEITLEQFQQGAKDIISKEGPRMSDKDLRRLMSDMGNMEYALQRELSRRGTPVPGNDPKKPN